VEPLRVALESRNPWTHLRLHRSPDQFQFAVLSDRTGGHRAGVSSRAVELLSLLQAEFVLSVGDLIEGYAGAEQAREQWREFQGYAGKLQMPFFYAPGDHQVGIVWRLPPTVNGQPNSNQLPKRYTATVRAGGVNSSSSWRTDSASGRPPSVGFAFPAGGRDHLTR
jgi:hypothetical protein